MPFSTWQCCYVYNKIQHRHYNDYFNVWRQRYVVDIFVFAMCQHFYVYNNRIFLEYVVMGCLYFSRISLWHCYGYNRPWTWHCYGYNKILFCWECDIVMGCRKECTTCKLSIFSDNAASSCRYFFEYMGCLYFSWISLWHGYGYNSPWTSLWHCYGYNKILCFFEFVTLLCI